MSYICPNLAFFSKYKELIDKNESSKVDYLESRLFPKKFKSDWEVAGKEILSKKRIFILGEPGIGKTRLLGELYSKVAKEECKKLFLDLKKVGGKRDLISFINDNESNNFCYEENYSDCKKCLKSEKFELKDDENIFLFFDALDEVMIGREFTEMVESIKKISDVFPKINIFVSCRLEYFSKEIEDKSFVFSNFGYAMVSRFVHGQITEFLENSGFPQDKIDKIKKKFEGRPEILQTPRYLRFISKIFQEDDLGGEINLKRVDVFEKIIDLELKEESIKDDRGFDGRQIKDVLGKIALIMELKQVNSIDKNDLEILFDTLESDNKRELLSKIERKYLYNKTLLKDNIDSVEFKNTQFQEYLASLEVINLGNIERTVFDLFYEKYIGSNERVFKYSCLPTLEFIVEKKPEFFWKILSYELAKAKRNKTIVSEYIFNLIKYTDSQVFSLDDRRLIFKQVFEYYQDHNRWLHEISYSLAGFFEDQFDILDKHYKNPEKLVRNNLFPLVRNLKRVGKLILKEEDKWKRRAKQLMEKGCASDEAVSFLASTNDRKLLKEVGESLLKNGTNTSIISLIISYRDESQCSSDIVDFYIDIIKKYALDNNHSSSIYAEQGLMEIEEMSLILYLLEKIKSDKDFFDYVFGIGKYYHRPGFNDDYNDSLDLLFKNIKEKSTDEILAVIKDIIVLCSQQDIITNTGFVSRLFSIVENKEAGYILNFLNTAEEIYNFKQAFVDNIKIDQVDYFINKLKPENSYILSEIFHEIKRHRGGDGERIHLKASENITFPDIKKQQDWDVVQYQEFKRVYENNEWEGLHFLYNNEIKIKEYLEDGIKVKIKGQILGFISNNDPANFKIEEKEGTVVYTNSIIRFALCLRFLEKDDLKKNKTRDNIINFLPFSSHWLIQSRYKISFEFLYDLVGDLSDKEINGFLNSAKSNNYRENFIDGFVKIAQEKRDKKFIPHFKCFVNSELVSLNKKIQCLEALVRLGEGSPYFIKEFSKVIKTGEEDKRFQQNINKIIIINFQDIKAIKWRMEQIKICNDNSHFQRMEWKEPFLKIDNNDRRLVESFNGLLEFAFKEGVSEEKKEILLELVLAYFGNLKKYGNYEYVLVLEKYLSSCSDKKNLGSLEYIIDSLRKEYSIFIGNRVEISDCVKKYNLIKKKIYLEVTNEYELFEKVKEVFDKDFRSWVDGGAYDLIGRNIGKQEDLIQRTIPTQLQNYFLRVGIDVKIYREVEGLDEDRPDLLISYGFLRPIVVELKRYQRLGDLKPEYREKLLKYMKICDSDYCIFALFQDDNKKTEADLLPKVKEMYKNDSNIEVFSYVCLEKKNSSNKAKK